jgi:Secretion system C-terminal sorting domain
MKIKLLIIVFFCWVQVLCATNSTASAFRYERLKRSLFVGADYASSSRTVRLSSLTAGREVRPNPIMLNSRSLGEREDFCQFVPLSAAFGLTLNGTAGNSPRSILESTVADQQAMMTFAFSRLAANWLQDSVQNNKDSLMAYLSLMPDISSRYLLADMYYEQGQNTLANQTLAEIPTQFRLNSTQVLEHTQYEALLALKITVRNANRKLNQLNATEKEVLQGIVNNSDRRAGVLANNILCFHYGICKDYPAILPIVNNQQRKAQGKVQMEDMALKVYPNPANSFVTFDYSKVDVSVTGSIEITDVTGKTIANLDITDKKGSIVWDTRSINNGVYLYKLIREGFPSLNGKFVIQH